MKSIFKYIIVSLIALSISSCEDVIDIDLETGVSQVVVDGFINNLEKEQKISLSMSRGYFDKGVASLERVKGATITVDDLMNNTSVTFIEKVEQDNDYEIIYTWTPQSASEAFQTRERTGTGQRVMEETFYNKQYRLNIELEDGTKYEAYTSLERVPTVDSIEIYKEKESLFTPVETILAEAHAVDFVGKDDFYWMKTWKNGQFLNKVQEMTLIHDYIQQKSNNQDVDGKKFNLPTRLSVNPSLDENEEGEVPYYIVGDEIYVELHSLTSFAFDFMTLSKEQMSNSGLFAKPVVNVPSNIKLVADSSTDTEALGVFSGSSVSTIRLQIDEEPLFKEDKDIRDGIE